MDHGLQIVSDGTAEGTRVLLDGVPIRGVTAARWELNARQRSAKLVLELENVELDVNHPVDPSVADELARLTST